MANNEFNFEGKVYEVVDGNIVNSRTMVVVCSDLANRISQQFNLQVKPTVKDSVRGDVSYLNNMIKRRTVESV